MIRDRVQCECTRSLVFLTKLPLICAFVRQSVDQVRDEIAKSRKGKSRKSTVVKGQQTGSDNALNLEEFRKFFKLLLKMEEIENLFYKCARARLPCSLYEYRYCTTPPSLL